MANDPFILFMLIIVGFYLALEIYFGYIRFVGWFERKLRLFRLGCKLLMSKNREIRAVGWATLRLILWESNEDDKPQ